MAVTETPNNSPTRPLMHIERGQKISKARVQINESFDAVNKLSDRMRPAYQVTPTLNPAQSAKQFRLIGTTSADYVWCHEWDGTTEGETTIYVAKPWFLRRGPFDGLTRDSITYTYSSNSRRVATKSGESAETQLITPSYLDDDVIFAISNISGGTGVVTAGVDGVPVEWLDLNVDGRMWAKLA